MDKRLQRIVFIENVSDGKTGNGILIMPTSGTFKFTVTNTVIVNNVFADISYVPQSGSPSANGVITSQ